MSTAAGRECLPPGPCHMLQGGLCASSDVVVNRSIDHVPTARPLSQGAQVA